jgi:hypothetical protein
MLAFNANGWCQVGVAAVASKLLFDDSTLEASFALKLCGGLKWC